MIGEPVAGHNVNVIPFDRKVKWAIYCFCEDGVNVIHSFLDQYGASAADQLALDAKLDFIETQGPEMVQSVLTDLENGLFQLTSKRTGGLEIHLVFHRETFGKREVTFLAGAVMKGKKLRPGYVKEMANERLEDLRDDPKKRRREWPTRPLEA